MRRTSDICHFYQLEVNSSRTYQVFPVCTTTTKFSAIFFKIPDDLQKFRNSTKIFRTFFKIFTIFREDFRKISKCSVRSDWTIKSKYLPLFTFWHSCVTVRAFFFQIQGIFHYFRTFKTEILHIYSLTGQILKQLSPQCR